jgi:hypothetical protein
MYEKHDINTDTNTLPGQNHTYLIDIPFYTLQSKNGCYLSHPQSILDNQWYIVADSKRVNVATTPHWDSAWVVYSIPDLRTLYSALQPARKAAKHADDFPSIVCTGTMIQGLHGMIQCLKITQLSFADVKKLEAQNTKKDTYQPVKNIVNNADWSVAPSRLRRKAQTTMQFSQQSPL